MSQIETEILEHHFSAKIMGKISHQELHRIFKYFM